MSERKVKARATAVRARDADYTRKARAKKRRQNAAKLRDLLMGAYDGLVPHLETPDPLARPAIAEAVDRIARAINQSWSI